MLKPLSMMIALILFAYSNGCSLLEHKAVGKWAFPGESRQLIIYKDGTFIDTMRNSGTWIKLDSNKIKVELSSYKFVAELNVISTNKAMYYELFMGDLNGVQLTRIE